MLHYIYENFFSVFFIFNFTAKVSKIFEIKKGFVKKK